MDKLEAEKIMSNQKIPVYRGKNIANPGSTGSFP